ncbi:conserved hypothetical protein [Verticillium alfalfae VaMs.102]|uniref:Uncharacterized protein n=1 Tax=Verticillium alfalfae (strain VaMs.102 / ATCC MYA-4576 / FGSC 10136) TaxID=526221 RepID=C9SX94_VERA1|nr:conserved hypothetical protein [Verticillium alfalfae VaMs.102]EEY23284.1 conserved hypothetical protein [Verticillium alfalfae VaMs.102]
MGTNEKLKVASIATNWPKIESRELQAAGIYLSSVPGKAARCVRAEIEERHQGAKRTASAAAEDRDHSVPASRHRKNSSAAENSLSDNQAQTPSWDLRLPEEIEAEGDPYWTSTSSRAGSKIPVAKMSPLPIPETFIDRNSPSSRRQSDVPREAESIAYPKTRSRAGSINALAEPAAAGTLQPAKRSATDVSPRKTTPTARKTSAPSKSNGSVSGRPRTRGGPNKDSTSSTGTTRPSTRSGELSPGNRAPEGEPPWMIGSYKPDPRLPPDQQLLPTVARRLQQEKWEKEGKFGSVYDKEFRPMTDDALLSPPVPGPSGVQEEEKQLQEQSRRVAAQTNREQEPDPEARHFILDDTQNFRQASGQPAAKPADARACTTIAPYSTATTCEGAGRLQRRTTTWRRRREAAGAASSCDPSVATVDGWMMGATLLRRYDFPFLYFDSSLPTIVIP